MDKADPRIKLSLASGALLDVVRGRPIQRSKVENNKPDAERRSANHSVPRRRPHAFAQGWPF